MPITLVKDIYPSWKTKLKYKYNICACMQYTGTYVPGMQRTPLSSEWSQL